MWPYSGEVAVITRSIFSRTRCFSAEYATLHPGYDAGIHAAVGRTGAAPEITADAVSWGAGAACDVESEGIDATSSTPQEFGKFIRAEIDKWGSVVKAAGVKEN